MKVSIFFCGEDYSFWSRESKPDNELIIHRTFWSRSKRDGRRREYERERERERERGCRSERERERLKWNAKGENCFIYLFVFNFYTLFALWLWLSGIRRLYEWWLTVRINHVLLVLIFLPLPRFTLSFFKKKKYIIFSLQPARQFWARIKIVLMLKSFVNNFRYTTNKNNIVIRGFGRLISYFFYKKNCILFLYVEFKFHSLQWKDKTMKKT